MFILGGLKMFSKKDKKELQKKVKLTEGKKYRIMNKEEIIRKLIEKEEVFREIQNEFLKKTQNEWTEIFSNIDACVMPVKNFSEACEDSQIRARNMVVDMNHPKFGKIQNVSSPIKYSRTPLTIRSLAPKVGQHTKQILKELNYTEEDIKNLIKSGIN